MFCRPEMKSTVRNLVGSRKPLTFMGVLSLAATIELDPMFIGSRAGLLEMAPTLDDRGPLQYRPADRTGLGGPRPVFVGPGPSQGRNSGPDHYECESYLQSSGRHHTPPNQPCIEPTCPTKPYNISGIASEQPHYVRRSFPKRASRPSGPRLAVASAVDRVRRHFTAQRPPHMVGPGATGRIPRRTADANWLCFHGDVIHRSSRNLFPKKHLESIRAPANWVCLARSAPGLSLSLPAAYAPSRLAVGNWLCLHRVVICHLSHKTLPKQQLAFILVRSHWVCLAS